eukprot:TRINITY_DN2037_c0_g1_i3.p1 TRINITY_DN2037_c0_g1~~TRINITY_DN2037_c0_g1_i3.p1  ORF type:complete len:181 (+),score=87.46 TRINITY_DN2037_c0_g1_i3:3-545(+)
MGNIYDRESLLDKVHESLALPILHRDYSAEKDQLKSEKKAAKRIKKRLLREAEANEQRKKKIHDLPLIPTFSARDRALLRKEFSFDELKLLERVVATQSISGFDLDFETLILLQKFQKWAAKHKQDNEKMLEQVNKRTKEGEENMAKTLSFKKGNDDDFDSDEDAETVPLKEEKQQQQQQ